MVARRLAAGQTELAGPKMIVRIDGFFYDAHQRAKFYWTLWAALLIDAHGLANFYVIFYVMRCNGMVITLLRRPREKARAE